MGTNEFYPILTNEIDKYAKDEKTIEDVVESCSLTMLGAMVLPLVGLKDRITKQEAKNFIENYYREECLRAVNAYEKAISQGVDVDNVVNMSKYKWCMRGYQAN